MAELVGVDVADACLASRGGDDAADGSAFDRGVVVGDEPTLGPDVLGVGGGTLRQERDEVGVQGDEPVVAQLAHRDAQPVGVADLGDGVGRQPTELAGGPQPGPG